MLKGREKEQDNILEAFGEDLIREWKEWLF